MKYIDGKGKVMGRLASHVAKLLLEGEQVYVGNVEKIIIVGDKRMILKKYRKKQELIHTRKGPYYPRRPDRIFKRTVKNMLPYQKHRGRAALENFRAFVGMPDEYFPKKAKFSQVKDADRGTPVKYIELGDVSKMIGGNF